MSAGRVAHRSLMGGGFEDVGVRPVGESKGAQVAGEVIAVTGGEEVIGAHAGILSTLSENDQRLFHPA